VENPHANADDILVSSGLEIVRVPHALTEDELDEALDGVEILGIRSQTRVTDRILKNHPQLLAVGAFSIGVNQIDIKAATAHGVAVFNAPFSNTRSVVELAVAEIIAMTRRLTERDKSLHDGVWYKSASGSHEVRGRTLGIVGYGNIGSQLSVIAEALGMRVIFYDTSEKLALGNAQAKSSLRELLSEADVVTLHVDGREGNAGMFGAEQFAQMKEGASFLNLSRGFVVDYAALAERIKDGSISGASVDVFPKEPGATPHIGGSTIEAQQNIGTFVAGKLGRYYRHGVTDLSVNLPRLALEPTDATRHRIAYVHRNTPGVLALVNQTFAEAGANIEGQILGTAAQTGYVITDISSEIPVEALAAINSMEDTIRMRVLSRPEK
jgi:D-3-phosphoglycerate dehydrogenase